MNKQQRKQISELTGKLSMYLTYDGVQSVEVGEHEALHQVVHGELSDLRDEVESLRDEEQGKFDNLPEAWQNGSKGEEFQAAIDELDNAISSLETAMNSADTEIEIPEGATEEERVTVIEEWVESFCDDVQEAIDSLDGI